MRSLWRYVKNILKRDASPAGQAAPFTSLDVSSILHQARAQSGHVPAPPEPKGLDWVDVNYPGLGLLTNSLRQLSQDIGHFRWDVGYDILSYDRARAGGFLPGYSNHTELRVSAKHMGDKRLDAYLGSVFLSDAGKSRLTVSLPPHRGYLGPDEKGERIKFKDKDMSRNIAGAFCAISNHTVKLLKLPVPDSPGPSADPSNPLRLRAGD